jgi:hypothetical protein
VVTSLSHQDDPAGTPYGRLASAWRTSFADARLRLHLLFAFAAVAVILPVQASFLLQIERRRGVTLPDPVLSALPPRDLTWPTFAVIYAAIAVGLGILLWSPRALAIGLQSYVVLVLLRIAVMFVTPLDPPPGMIPLEDPIIESMATKSLLTRDLFFSGHTSMLFLLFLAVPVGRFGKAAFLAAMVGVAAGVLCQHVHYTVDVLVAPAFAYASYSIVQRLHVVVSASPAPQSSTSMS